MAQNMYFTERTITTHLKIDHISDADIDDPEETLILLLELLLVEYLNRENAVLIDSPAPNPPLTPLFFHRSSSNQYVGHNDVQIERLIPIWVQGLLDH